MQKQPQRTLPRGTIENPASGLYPPTKQTPSSAGGRGTDLLGLNARYPLPPQPLRDEEEAGKTEAGRRSYHSVPTTPSLQPPTGRNPPMYPDTSGAASASSSSAAEAAASAQAEKFGLVGLLNVIKMTNTDLNTLALGSDLTTLGLNLNATEPLYTSFTSPWTETPDLSDKAIPSCYQVSTAPPALEKRGTFADETLFYIFYSMPGDEMQIHAAIELYNRNWRYHRELHLWLTKDPGTPLIVKAPTYERGTYVFWDVNAWSRVAKEFLLVYAMLEEAPQFLTESQSAAPSRPASPSLASSLAQPHPPPIKQGQTSFARPASSTLPPGSAATRQQKLKT